MKKLALFLCSIFLSFGFLTSCGMATDSIEIESVKAVLDEETGVTTVTIRYLDDIEPPLVFEIPAGVQGIQGLEGVGIDRIEEKLDDKGERIGVIVYYTDAEKEPFFISLTDGKDGISIKDVQSETQEDGTIKLTFFDDNGEQVGEEIIIPAGTEITNIESNPQEDGSIEVKISYSNGVEPEIFTIDAARGVKEITSSIENDQYVITFDYTDGTNSSISFDRPNTWLSGYGHPDVSLGIDGDFYFDTSNKQIYQKIDGDWAQVANLNPDQKTYTISFVVDSNMIWEKDKKNEYTLNAGESFASRNYDLPLPSHLEGYTFLGWYAVDEQTIITVNHSRFTDLTPVSGNLTLYAHWERTSD